MYAVAVVVVAGAEAGLAVVAVAGPGEQARALFAAALLFRILAIREEGETMVTVYPPLP